MSDHLIAEAHRHAMALPTTHPTHADIAWYVREVSELRAEVERLRAGIGECLRTNAHLADGEDCTLIGLKRCLHDPTAAPRQSALDATPRPSE